LEHRKKPNPFAVKSYRTNQFPSLLPCFYLEVEEKMTEHFFSAPTHQQSWKLSPSSGCTLPIEVEQNISAQHSCFSSALLTNSSSYRTFSEKSVSLESSSTLSHPPAGANRTSQRHQHNFARFELCPWRVFKVLT